MCDLLVDKTEEYGRMLSIFSIVRWHTICSPHTEYLCEVLLEKEKESCPCLTMASRVEM